MGRKTVIKESDYKSVKKYEFQLIDKPYKILTDKECLDYLKKWSLDKRLKILSYSIENSFEIFDENQLIANLFQDAEVLQNLDCRSFSSSKDENEAIRIIETEHVPCTVLSMEFFDKIYDCGIVLKDGTIRKCFEDYVDGVIVADELRNLLIVEESDNYDVFKEEREEFIFLLFKHLCIGGELNQYEDNVNPYLLMTKILYKDLICVRKTGMHKETRIISKVLKVTCKKNGQSLIPSTQLNHQDFLYVVINPTLKNLTILFNTW